MMALTQFIYKMPCLSKYVFNHRGECMHERTGNIKKVTLRHGKSDSYELEMDNGKKGFITMGEVLHYIGHLKQQEQFNPMVNHHFVYYRMVFKYYKYRAA